MHTNRFMMCLLTSMAIACGQVTPDVSVVEPIQTITTVCVSDSDCAKNCERCVTGACGGVAVMGTVCRSSKAGDKSIGSIASPTCDPVEVCDGTTAVCPSDVIAMVGTVCGGPAIGPCESSSKVCNASGVCLARKPEGTICKGAGVSAICDPADRCDGVRSLCPGKYAAAGVDCGGGLQCNGFGLCR